MSEQTRMSKYKDLRDNIDDDTYVPHEEDDADDDFLSFIPKSNHRESLEPKTYETLKYESIKNIDIRCFRNDGIRCQCPGRHMEWRT